MPLFVARVSSAGYCRCQSVAKRARIRTGTVPVTILFAARVSASWGRGQAALFNCVRVDAGAALGGKLKTPLGLMSEQRFAEKLLLLAEHAQALLTRLYRVKLVGTASRRAGLSGEVERESKSEREIERKNNLSHYSLTLSVFFLLSILSPLFVLLFLCVDYLS